LQETISSFPGSWNSKTPWC